MAGNPSLHQVSTSGSEALQLGTAMPPMQKHKHYNIKSKINKNFGDFTFLQTRNEIYGRGRN